MSDNKNLHKANKEKNDEFYTQLSDIENVLNFLIKKKPAAFRNVRIVSKHILYARIIIKVK